MMSEHNEEQQYNDDVRYLAQDIQAWAKENDYPDREQVMDCIHEFIDGCTRVSYTWKAKMCVACSPNAGAYFEQFGNYGAVDGDSINWSRLAYCAFEADVIEFLNDDGFDVHDDRPGYVEPEDN